MSSWGRGTLTSAEDEGKRLSTRRVAPERGRGEVGRGIYSSRPTEARMESQAKCEAEDDERSENPHS